jgi:hypothetical protein
VQSPRKFSLVPFAREDSKQKESKQSKKLPEQSPSNNTGDFEPYETSRLEFGDSAVLSEEEPPPVQKTVNSNGRQNAN